MFVERFWFFRVPLIEDNFIEVFFYFWECVTSLKVHFYYKKFILIENQ